MGHLKSALNMMDQRPQKPIEITKTLIDTNESDPGTSKQIVIIGSVASGVAVEGFEDLKTHPSDKDVEMRQDPNNQW